MFGRDRSRLAFCLYFPLVMPEYGFEVFGVGTALFLSPRQMPRAAGHPDGLGRLAEPGAIHYCRMRRRRGRAGLAWFVASALTGANGRFLE
jgi:hypothetical protein